MNYVFGGSPSDELWADFDAAEAAFGDAMSRAEWNIKYQDTERKARESEEMYRLAVEDGLPESVTSRLATEMTYAKDALTALHEERRRRDS